jgi:serine/threonine-protein kinase mTOR
VQCRYEKLHRWDEALKAYTVKSSQTSGPLQNLDATLGSTQSCLLSFGSLKNNGNKVKFMHILGRMRCLAALARWEDLSALCREQWTGAEPSARLEMAPMVVDTSDYPFCCR